VSQAQDDIAEPEPPPEIPVLYQDERAVAVHKPPGILVHRGPRGGGPWYVLQLLRDTLGRLVYPVHRLDRAASGVLVFGLSGEAAGELHKALARPEAVKEYLVLCRGTTDEAFESRRELSNAKKVKQAAHSEFRRLATFDRMSLLQARIHTGRRHQIRRHLHHLKHQVIGDTKYGKGRINQAQRDANGLPRMFLHARRLVLPLADGPLELEAPLAPDLREYLLRVPGCDPDWVASL
jgi:tRNA pseudouridine65 synthase